MRIRRLSGQTFPTGELGGYLDSQTVYSSGGEIPVADPNQFSGNIANNIVRGFLDWLGDGQAENADKTDPTIPPENPGTGGLNVGQEINGVVVIGIFLIAILAARKWIK